MTDRPVISVLRSRFRQAKQIQTGKADSDRQSRFRQAKQIQTGKTDKAGKTLMTDQKDRKEAAGESGKIFLTWDQLKKNSDGMVPVIVQDYQNDQVLMLAYMNREAFEKTLAEGRMTYWSRSRDELWTKGMTSGHFQYVQELRIDCDCDTILAKVEQVGAACHTGNRSCFYRVIERQEIS